MTVLVWLAEHGPDVLVAVGTGALAIFTARLARRTGQALTTSNRVAAATEQQMHESKRTADEAYRSRVDSRAPRLAVQTDVPEWPPYLDRARRQMPYRNELPLLAPTSLERAERPGADRELIVPEDVDFLLWFRVKGIVMNEGLSSARVAMYNEIATPAVSAYLGIEIAPPRQLQTALDTDYRGGQYLLLPGEALYFEWAWGHSIAEWIDAHENPEPLNPLGSGFLTIMGTDWIQNGIEDHVYIEAQCRPLAPVPGRASHWSLNPEQPTGITVYPVVRRYIGEADHAAPEAPWHERYAEWNARRSQNR